MSESIQQKVHIKIPQPPTAVLLGRLNADADTDTPGFVGVYAQAHEGDMYFAAHPVRAAGEEGGEAYGTLAAVAVRDAMLGSAATTYVSGNSTFICAGKGLQVPDHPESPAAILTPQLAEHQSGAASLEQTNSIISSVVTGVRTMLLTTGAGSSLLFGPTLYVLGEIKKWTTTAPTEGTLRLYGASSAQLASQGGVQTVGNTNEMVGMFGASMSSGVSASVSGGVAASMSALVSAGMSSVVLASVTGGLSASLTSRWGSASVTGASVQVGETRDVDKPQSATATVNIDAKKWIELGAGDSPSVELNSEKDRVRLETSDTRLSLTDEVVAQADRYAIRVGNAGIELLGMQTSLKPQTNSAIGAAATIRDAAITTAKKARDKWFAGVAVVCGVAGAIGDEIASAAAGGGAKEKVHGTAEGAQIASAVSGGVGLVPITIIYQKAVSTAQKVYRQAVETALAAEKTAFGLQASNPATPKVHVGADHVTLEVGTSSLKLTQDKVTIKSGVSTWTFDPIDGLGGPGVDGG